MNLGKRLNTALAHALLMSEGSTVDPAKDIIRGGDPDRTPRGNGRPLVYQWAERFEKLIEQFEREVKGLAPLDGRAGERLRSRMDEYEGRRPVEVAFWEDCSIDMVRRIRKEQGRNMLTGYRLERDEKPLTAHPRHTLTQIEEAA